VALVCHADLLINLSDIDGLYDKDPRRFADAKLISRVDGIDDGVLAMAGGAGTERGTGGMATKLKAAKIVVDAGIPMFILNGKDPTVLYDLLDGKRAGTYFSTEKGSAK
jgi:glutamate 5-kinase